LHSQAVKRSRTENDEPVVKGPQGQNSSLSLKEEEGNKSTTKMLMLYKANHQNSTLWGGGGEEQVNTYNLCTDFLQKLGEPVGRILRPVN
jgi:hypothetical protein